MAKEEKFYEGKEFKQSRAAVDILYMLKKGSDEKHPIKKAQLLKMLNAEEDIDGNEISKVDARTDMSFNLPLLNRALNGILRSIYINPESYSKEEREMFRIRYKDFEKDLIQQTMTAGKKEDKSKQNPSITDLQFIHDFSYDELDTIISAVENYPYASKSEKAELIEKLEKQSSDYYLKHRQAAGNNSALYFHNEFISADIKERVDVIIQAIKENKKINFNFNKSVFSPDTDGSYFKSNAVILTPLTECNEKTGKEQIKIYEVSPYNLLFYNKKAYLMCSMNEGDKIYKYRVDLMTDVTIKNENRRPASEFKEYQGRVNWKKYVDTHPDGSYGDTVEIQLKVKADRLGYVRELFGEALNCIMPGQEYTLVSVKTTAFAALNIAMQYGDILEIVRPLPLREAVIKKCEMLTKKYNGK